MVRQAERETDAIDLLNRLQEVRLPKGPEPGRRRGRTACQQQTIDSAASGFIRRLHAGNVRVGPDIVGRDEEVFQFHQGLGPVLQRTCRVDHQRFGIRHRIGVRKLDIRIEEPCDQVRVIDWRGSADIQVLF